MKQITMEKLYRCLCDEAPVVTVPADIAAKAIKPIERMLDISARLGL